MTRTMVYLPDEIHQGLKYLAVERRTSMAKLVQEAVETLYREDLEDLQIGRKRMQEYLAHPERAIPYETYRKKRLKLK